MISCQLGAGILMTFIVFRFGRLPVFITAIACQVITGCVAAFIPYLWLFYILYFFQGAAQVAAALTGFVLGKSEFFQQ